VQVNIQQATLLTGKSRATIQRHIKAGKLSRTDKGIDTAELVRVYGELLTTHDNSVSHSKDNAVSEREQWLMRQVEALQQQLLEQKAEHLDREKRLMALLESGATKKRFGLF